MVSPFVLLPNSTADNRAANIPEFANIRYDDLDNIDAPAVSHYRDQFEADRLIKAGQIDSGIKVLRRALNDEKRDRSVRSELMVTLAEWIKDPDESVRILKDAIRSDSNYSEMYLNMGIVLGKRGPFRSIGAASGPIALRNRLSGYGPLAEAPVSRP